MSRARGNGNAYLTVSLPPRQREALCKIAHSLGKIIEAVASPPPPSSPPPVAAASISGSGSFDIMSPAAIHMTFLFCGKTLAELPAATLCDFHEATSINCSTTSETSGDGGGGNVVTRRSNQITRRGCKLTFERLQLFPPGKNNLIVAIYRPEKTLAALQRAVAHSFLEACQSRSEAIKSSTAAAAALDSWQPHVTLGKIRASRADVGRVGSLALSRATQLANELLSRPILPLGIGMSGTVPPQRWLDWDLRFTDDVRNGCKSAQRTAEDSVAGHKAQTQQSPPSGLEHVLPSSQQHEEDGDGDGGDGTKTND